MCEGSPKVCEGLHNRRVGPGRQGGHGPKVYEGSQNRRVGPIVKVVTAPKHCTCAVDLIVKDDSKFRNLGQPRPAIEIYNLEILARPSPARPPDQGHVLAARGRLLEFLGIFKW